MRLKIILENCARVAVPINHQDCLAGVIYHLLAASNTDYAQFLHDEGYASEEGGGKRFKLFVFSGLRLPRNRREIAGSVLWIAPGTIEWLIASPVADFLTHCATGLLAEGAIRVNTAAFRIAQVQTLPAPALSESTEFTSLTPIVVSRPAADSPAHYLRADDPQFSASVRKNLLRKYRAVHGRDPADDRFQLTFNESYLARAGGSKLIAYKGIQIRGVLAPFTVEGSIELMRIGLEAGFGEKNSAGFGMAEVSR